MKLLYVDDDKEDREFFCYAVDSLEVKLHCLTVSDPQIALRLLKRQPIDIVLLDYRMPGLNVSDFLTTLKASQYSSSLQVYMYSTFMMDEEKEICIRAGATDCIDKLTNIEEIATLITRLVSTETIRRQSERAERSTSKRI